LVSRSERVLVTGGTGFTGRLLLELLRENGYEVVSLGHDAIETDAFNVDLCDFSRLVAILSEVRPAVIIHLAGVAAPSHGKIDEIYKANVVGTANLFSSLVATKLRPRLVVIASSAQVYATGNKDSPLREDSPLAPRSHYAVSKRATEEIAGLYSDHFHVIIARPFNYTGPGQSQSFLVPKIVQHYAERRHEIRVGDLDLFRDFSDVRRPVEAYSRLISMSIAPTTVNICSGRTIHLAEIFKTMEEISGHSAKIVVDQSLFRVEEPRLIVGSASYLESLIGLLPNPEFRETLLRMYNSCMQRIAASEQRHRSGRKRTV
jgi:nucleoside-diphosphate-sugar epimerase